MKNIIMKKTFINISIITLFLMFFSCSKRAPRIKCIKELSSYNEKVIKGEQNNELWVQSPLMIATRLSRASEVSSETNVTVKKINKGELPSDVKIYIYEKGVLDDSNPEARYFFHLKKTNDKWRIVN